MYSGQAILMVNQIGPDRPVAPPSIRVWPPPSQATGTTRMRPCGMHGFTSPAFRCGDHPSLFLTIGQHGTQPLYDMSVLKLHDEKTLPIHSIL